MSSFEKGQGILQTDGLKQYLSIGNGTGMTHILCWAHARRRFAEIVKANPKAQKAKKVVTLIGNLYHADNQVRERWLAGEMGDDAFRSAVQPGGKCKGERS